VEPKSSGTSACRSLQRHLTSVQRYSPTSPLGNAALTRPLLAATTPRDRCSPCDDGHHRRAQTAHNGNPIVPDIGQSGLRLLFTCIPITVISVVLSGDPMGATATAASLCWMESSRNRRATRVKRVLLPSKPLSLRLP
jgi:hypothetical protein